MPTSTPRITRKSRATPAALPPGLGEDVVVLKPSVKRFFGHGVPGVQPEELGGRLIVIEGADGSGRSTQIARLVDWL